MNFREILFNILFEEVENKKLFKYCIINWFGENPTQENINRTELLLTKFFQLKKNQKLNISSPSIITFFHKFRDFNPEHIFNAQQYTLHQMEFLIDEFFDINTNEEEENDDTPEILKGKELSPTEKIIKASKELWFTENKYLIANENGFRIYHIPDRATAIHFGYYERFVFQNPPFSSPKHFMPWCIVNYKIGPNLYGNYREKGRTFYFVIDETKNPKIEKDIQKNKYYLTALQPTKDSRTGYRLTNILNDGSDPEITREQLIQIYPKLEKYINNLERIPYNNNIELGPENKDVIDKINEIEGSEYEFAAMLSKNKKKYIDRGRIITKKTSWNSMNDGLKNGYINITGDDNFKERFTFALWEEIKKNKQILRTLENRLKMFGFSISNFVSWMIEDDFKEIGYSSENENIIILQTKNTYISHYGVYDVRNDKWIYDFKDGYEHPSTFFYQRKNGNRFLVEIYSKNNIDDEASFVSIHTSNDFKKRYHLMTYKNWAKLKEILEKDLMVVPKFSEYSDIKEKENIYKQRN